MGFFQDPGASLQAAAQHVSDVATNIATQAQSIGQQAIDLAAHDVAVAQQVAQQTVDAANLAAQQTISTVQTAAAQAVAIAQQTTATAQAIIDQANAERKAAVDAAAAAADRAAQVARTVAAAGVALAKNIVPAAVSGATALSHSVGGGLLIAGAQVSQYTQAAVSGATALSQSVGGGLQIAGEQVSQYTQTVTAALAQPIQAIAQGKNISAGVGNALLAPITGMTNNVDAQSIGGLAIVVAATVLTGGTGLQTAIAATGYGVTTQTNAPTVIGNAIMAPFTGTGDNPAAAKVGAVAIACATIGISIYASPAPVLANTPLVNAAGSSVPRSFSAGLSDGTYTLPTDDAGNLLPLAQDSAGNVYIYGPDGSLLTNASGDNLLMGTDGTVGTAQELVSSGVSAGSYGVSSVGSPPSAFTSALYTAAGTVGTVALGALTTAAGVALTKDVNRVFGNTPATPTPTPTPTPTSNNSTLFILAGGAVFIYLILRKAT
jgi:hypothetical protein